MSERYENDSLQHNNEVDKLTEANVKALDD